MAKRGHGDSMSVLVALAPLLHRTDVGTALGRCASGLRDWSVTGGRRCRSGLRKRSAATIVGSRIERAPRRYGVPSQAPRLIAGQGPPGDRAKTPTQGSRCAEGADGIVEHRLAQVAGSRSRWGQ